MHDPAIENESKSVAIIASYGKSELTARLVDQLHEEGCLCEIYVIDNRGDYCDDRVIVIKPGRNIGWLRASNLGAAYAIQVHQASHLFFLNNDIVLCPGFVAHMLLSWNRCEKPALLAPMYDCVFAHQHPAIPLGRADQFVRGATFIRRVPFVDGTAFLTSTENWLLANGLDHSRFGTFGWGSDFNLAMQLRHHALHCYVTEACYINHFRASTAHDVYGKGNYEKLAFEEMRAGLSAKYGQNWEQLLHQGNHIYPI